MTNFSSTEVHEDENNTANYAYAEKQGSRTKSSLVEKYNKRSLLSHQTSVLSKDAALNTVQKKLLQDIITLPSAFVFCATALSSGAEDVTEDFITEFNSRRGNQEMLAKAYRMLYKTRCLAGLEPHFTLTDIPSARRNFFLLIQLDNRDIKLAALENLILVLQNDRVSKESAFDLIDLAIDLMRQMDRELMQTQLIEEQIKICEAYGMVSELIQWHYGKKHFGGITSELKRQLILTVKTLEDLNTHENINLHYAAAHAIEGFKRLKDDCKELVELGERVFHLIVGIVSTYNDAPNMDEIGLAFKDFDLQMKHSWYNLTLLFNDLAKSAYTNFHQLIALELMVQENWKEQNWKFLYNALQKFADISIHGATPEIRNAAFNGHKMIKSQLPGFNSFTNCNYFKQKVDNKPIVHFKAPKKKDPNISIRYLSVQELIRINGEAPDAEIRKEAKLLLLDCLDCETDPSIRELLDKAIPNIPKIRKKWMSEADNYNYSLKKQPSLYLTDDPVQQLAFAYFARLSSNASEKRTFNQPFNEKVLKRNASQKTQISTPSLKAGGKTSSLTKTGPESISNSPKHKTAAVKKTKPLSDHEESHGSLQSMLLGKCVNIDPKIIEQSIEFNQDIHLLDKDKLYMTKAGIQKILQLMEEVKDVTALDFRKCQIQPEGLTWLAQNLLNMNNIRKIFLPAGLSKENIVKFNVLFQDAGNINIILAKAKEDLQFGTLLVQSKFIVGGINYFKRGLKKIESGQLPELSVQISISLAEALIFQKAHSEAKTVLLEASKLDPENDTINYLLASIYVKEKDHLKAAKFFMKTSNYKPEHVEIGTDELSDILQEQHQKHKRKPVKDST